jgi:DNA-binding protein HU-beta
VNQPATGMNKGSAMFNFCKNFVDSNYNRCQKRSTQPAGIPPAADDDSTQDHFRNHSYCMNKAELVDAVAKSLGTASRAEAERAVTAVVDGIKTGIRKDKSVQLVGFGTFRVSERAARMGINPKTGEKIKIKKSKTVKFAVGKELKGKL